MSRTVIVDQAIRDEHRTGIADSSAPVKHAIIRNHHVIENACPYVEKSAPTKLRAIVCHYDRAQAKRANVMNPAAGVLLVPAIGDGQAGNADDRIRADVEHAAGVVAADGE